MSGTNPNAHRRWVKSVPPSNRCRHPRPNETGAGRCFWSAELAVEADDEETFNEAVAELDPWKKNWRSLSSAVCSLANMTRRLLPRYSGGVWRYGSTGLASMLERMYLRWAESRGFKTESSKSRKVKWRVLNP